MIRRENASAKCKVRSAKCKMGEKPREALLTRTFARCDEPVGRIAPKRGETDAAPVFRPFRAVR
jgi:hypothetical protein